jgi:septum formation protein
MKLKLILASSSPRRAEILRNAGFAFEIQPAHVDETPLPDERADDYVLRLADTKARTAAQYVDRSMNRDAGRAVVIGADTVVVVDGQILGKPADAEDARRMLRLLSGRDHDVLTGLSFVSIPERHEATLVESTCVSFLPISAQDIEDYLLTGEPFDKAGAYGIQGIGGRFIRRIEGCYFNVMGLPLSRVWSIVGRMEEEEQKNTAAG